MANFALDQSFVENVNEIWSEIGYDEKQRSEFLNNVQQKLSKFYLDSIQHASRVKEELKQETSLIEGQILELQSALGGEDVLSTVENASLLQSRSVLKSGLTSLQQVRTLSFWKFDFFVFSFLLLIFFRFVTID